MTCRSPIALTITITITIAPAHVVRAFAHRQPKGSIE